MANEAICIETPTRFSRRVVADGTAIPLGTYMKFTGDNTAAAVDGDSTTFAGISWFEKVANDGVTEIPVALNGVWDLTDSGSGVTLGSIVSVGGANLIKTSTEAELITGDAIGKAEETASANEVIRVRVGEMI